MDLLENIKRLYEQVENKKEFHALVAEEFQIATESARVNWFSKWKIKDMYGIHKNLNQFTQNYIAKQNNALTV